MRSNELSGLRDLEGSESDERLMLRVQADEPHALDLLYRRHASQALRIARQICRDDGRGEDAVQEAFVSIWRSRAAYLPSGSFRGWLMCTVRNRALDTLRRDAAQKRPPPANFDQIVPDSAAGSPLDAVIARDERESMRISLQHLPEAQSAIIELAFFDGLTHAEIATRPALPAGTVKGRMRLGLEKMRRQSSRPRAADLERLPTLARPGGDPGELVGAVTAQR